MLAFGLCLGLFAYWLFVGSAVVRGLVASRSRVQDLLLSPVAGFGVTLLGVFMINRLGVPVKHIGPALTVTLFVLAGVAHVVGYRRTRLREPRGSAPGPSGAEPEVPTTARARFAPLLNPKSTALAFLPFLFVILVAAVLTGRPMLFWGFDWLSFCNDDMTNYTLSGDRFLNHGFLEPPHVADFVGGRDWTQAYWSQHVPSMVRPGSELAVAWVASLTGLSTHQAFMPLIVGYHLMLVSAAAGLVHRSDERRGAALLTAVLCACSAQLTFGTVYQLIAQTCGLSLLCANLAMVCRTFEGFTWRRLAAHGLLAAVVLTTQLVVYPEVNPFLAGGFGVWLAVALVRRRLPVWRTAGVIGIGAVLTLVLLNAYVYETVAFMIAQRRQAQAGGDVTITLFPFFLVPTGLSNFWGFTTLITQPYGDRLFVALFNLSIAAGAALMVLAFVAAVWLSWRGEPAAGMALVCLLLAVALFKIDAGFGLYKLAMFAQPFVLGTVAIAWAAVCRRRPWLLPLALLLILPSARIQATYIGFSQDQGATFNEVPGATRTRLIREFRDDVVDPWVAKREAEGKPPAFMVDAYNISLSKLLLLYTRGIPTSVPASPFTLKAIVPGDPPLLARPAVRQQALDVNAETSKVVQTEPFEFVPEMPGADPVSFWYVSAGGRRRDAPCDDPDTLLVATTPRTNLLNRRQFVKYSHDQAGVLRVTRPSANFDVRPLRDVRNYLLFMASTKSLPYFDTGDPTYISIYQLEDDPVYFTGDTMAGVGPYQFFEVLNPDAEVRLCLELSASLKADGDNALPPAMVVGEWRAALPFVGRGAGRVFSPPIRPKRVNGRYYVGIDMGRMGSMFKSPRDLLLGWFGRQVAVDRRRLVGFARDISLVSEAEYRKLDPPSAVRSWVGTGSDLRHPDLEFAGFYEDGWMAEHGYLVLKAPAQRSRLVVSGQIPGGAGFEGFGTVLTVLVDGVAVPCVATQDAKQKPGTDRLTNGLFTLTADLPPGPPGRRKVEFRSSEIRRLGFPDGRPAGVQFSSVQIEAVKE